MSLSAGRRARRELAFGVDEGSRCPLERARRRQPTPRASPKLTVVHERRSRVVYRYRRARAFTTTRQVARKSASCARTRRRARPFLATRRDVSRAMASVSSHASTRPRATPRLPAARRPRPSHTAVVKSRGAIPTAPVPDRRDVPPTTGRRSLAASLLLAAIVPAPPPPSLALESYAGVGLEIFIAPDGNPTVVEAFGVGYEKKAGPAWDAGVRLNDKILSIDGARAADAGGLAAVADALRGPAGSTVELEVKRGGRGGGVETCAVVRALVTPSERSCFLSSCARV